VCRLSSNVAFTFSVFEHFSRGNEYEYGKRLPRESSVCRNLIASLGVDRRGTREAVKYPIRVLEYGTASYSVFTDGYPI